ncbi:kinesin-like protein KIF20B [Strix uralensis]|uniref:kinesin-like protein KIF20B n=1 Tax=Strix uralensis TaxID=36305 RepID=UPI003DA734E1
MDWSWEQQWQSAGTPGTSICQQLGHKSVPSLLALVNRVCVNGEDVYVLLIATSLQNRTKALYPHGFELELPRWRSVRSFFGSRNFRVIDLIVTQDNTVTTMKRKCAEENSKEVIESSQFKASCWGKRGTRRERLRQDLSESPALVQSLEKGLQRKEEEHGEKQIQQVQNQVCRVQSEEKSLRNKGNELQKIKTQFSKELEIKQRTVLQFKKEQLNNEKLEEISKQYEKACKELEAWKQKYRELNNQSNSDWQQKNEAKYQTDRKNWLEEKMRLISQVKEAESHRNREMRRFGEDRKRCVEQQAEIERLAAQLVEEASNLPKRREERHQLVEALEVQLRLWLLTPCKKIKKQQN